MMKAKYPKFHLGNKQIIRICNQKFTFEIGSKEVLPPSETSIAMARVINGISGNNVLDIGSGCGILTVMLAQANCSNIWINDINPEAIECTLRNLEQNGFAKKINSHIGDFNTWRPDIKFDYIICNPPFMPLPTGSLIISKGINMAVDGGEDGVEAITKIGKNVSKVLSQNGLFIFALPRFVAYQKVLELFSEIFHIETLNAGFQAYWPAEIDDKFKTHIIKINNKYKTRVWQKDGQLLSNLKIIKAKLK